MGLFSWFLGDKCWEQIPGAFVSAARDALGQSSFTRLLSLSRRYALTTEGVFQRAETLGIDLDSELVSLAFLLCSLGNSIARRCGAKDAERAYRLSLSLKSDHWPSSFGLAILYCENGWSDDALRIAQEVLDLFDASPDKAGGLADIRRQLAEAENFGVLTGDLGETETCVRDALLQVISGRGSRHRPASSEEIDDLAEMLSISSTEPGDAPLYTPRGIIYTLGGISNRMMAIGMHYLRAKKALALASLEDEDSLGAALREGGLLSLMPFQRIAALEKWALKGPDSAAFYAAEQLTLGIDMRSEWEWAR